MRLEAVIASMQSALAITPPEEAGGTVLISAENTAIHQ